MDGFVEGIYKHVGLIVNRDGHWQTRICSRIQKLFTVRVACCTIHVNATNGLGIHTCQVFVEVVSRFHR